MRTGASCAVQQALTPDAAAVVKQAVVLAKRRGHAQVTPLHVANTMLAVSSGLFRVACLESHSHPLQCKALELCFNVALNRLPASSSNPMLAPHHNSQQYPSISNALVATFKRAQAHQRRGSVENQQQPILAVKIELEQLIISILDDPSVSRVMREAGFLSSQVKTNVEKAVSKENSLLTLKPSSPPQTQNDIKLNKSVTEPDQPIRNEDINFIIETLVNSKKRKSLVVVGESISNLESTVKGLMDRVDKGTVPDGLKEIKLISIPPLYSFCNLHREEVEQKIGELTCLVKSLVGKGVVLYLGDLKWISDYKVSLERERGYYCSVEHMMMEIARLIWGINGENIGKFWLMGIATFQTYMRCRTGNHFIHSLETLWGLHPVTIPANSLGLSLVSERDEGNEAKQRRLENQCCADCSVKFEAEVEKLKSEVYGKNEPTLSIMPSWLKNESRKPSHNDQNCDAVKKLRHRWNSFCSSAHRRLDEGTLALSFPSTSCFSFDQQNPNLFHVQENDQHGDYSLINPLSSNPSSTPNSTSSSDIMEMEYTPKLKQFNAENLNILCQALEKKVPWQSEIIPEVSGTILQCRSGMIRRKENITDIKEETWLFFLGPDTRGKEKISRELAKVVFGSYSSFASIGLSSFVSSSEDCPRSKRGRDEESSMSYIDRFTQAVAANPHRVFMVEDLEQADYCSQLGIKKAIEKGRIRNQNGEEVGLFDAIIILCCESFSFRSRDCSPSPKRTSEDGSPPADAADEEARNCVSLDLNISFHHDSTVEDQPVDCLRILENVDRRVVFRFQDL